MRQTRQQRAEEGAELLTGYDNLLCVSDNGAPTSVRKQFCVACGLPRDAELASRLPCGACGTTGTQKRPPGFDEFGDRVPDEVIAARKAEQLRAMQAGRAAARAAQVAAQPKQPAPVKAARQAAATKPAAKATTQDVFLSMMME